MRKTQRALRCELWLKGAAETERLNGFRSGRPAAPLAG